MNKVEDARLFLGFISCYWRWLRFIFINAKILKKVDTKGLCLTYWDLFNIKNIRESKYLQRNILEIYFFKKAYVLVCDVFLGIP